MEPEVQVCQVGLLALNPDLKRRTVGLLELVGEALSHVTPSKVKLVKAIEYVELKLDRVQVAHEKGPCALWFNRH